MSATPPRVGETRRISVREIASDARECERLSEQITAVAGDFGFESDELVAIALAVDEALRNAVLHGNLSDRSKKIRVECAVDPEDVRIAITDEGSGFDVGSLPDPNLVDHVTTGDRRGIFLMGQLMSGIRFVPPGNRVELWRHRGDRKWPHVRLPAYRCGDGSPRLLLAEDDDEMRSLLARAFRRAGYEVTACGDGWSLFRVLGHCLFLARRDDEARVDLVVSDVRMPFLTGLRVLEAARQIGVFPPVIVITAFGSEDVHARARALGAAAVVDKPFDVEELIAAARVLAPPRGRRDPVPASRDPRRLSKNGA
jgi:CheY-like chemotaxis protein/anti-sigma regulatory factor (Ser/Thr protein kinase)